ncbi:MAG: cbb3-type cytochrome oxidase assembly protein CcoS [Saprospiraceae bacterium]|nr:cbb3-type cytochrome oxidase assembly protein CcoS [Saprospiraceae bacterium]MDW8228884.1 cbb3-type cytochrome oxidase assembly protein CcoS [Saprospiraceae bacterium]
MEVIFVLILISLAVAAGFLLAYFWAMRAGQYDDDYTPAVRMLFDDELVRNEGEPVTDYAPGPEAREAEEVREKDVNEHPQRIS